MVCPQCGNQYDVHNAVIIVPEGCFTGSWMCPVCRISLTDTDSLPDSKEFKKQQEADTNQIGVPYYQRHMSRLTEDVVETVRQGLTFIPHTVVIEEAKKL